MSAIHLCKCMADIGILSQSQVLFREWYGVALVSRIDKFTGSFYRILSLLYVSFAKETYHLIDPTNQRHPIYNS